MEVATTDVVVEVAVGVARLVAVFSLPTLQILAALLAKAVPPPL